MDPEQINVLLIEDNPGDVRLIRELLADRGGPAIVLEAAARLGTGLERLAAGGIDVVLLDLSLPDSSGLDTFLQVRALATKLPVVVLTGLDDEMLAVKAVQEGAQDYLVKGQADGRVLVRSLHYAIERTRRALAEERLRATGLGFLTAPPIQQKLFPATPPPLVGSDI